MDVLENRTTNISLHDRQGFVRLVDIMPRFTEAGTVDGAVVQAARVSYGKGETTKERDESLIRYLMRHSHTSPFEMVELKWHMKLPIFLARQFVRHRTANINEISGRYTEMKEEYYIPALNKFKYQSTTNHQGGGEIIEEGLATQMVEAMYHNDYTFNDYKKLIAGGLSKEMARINLPLSTYTEWYWKIDLHNLLHFLHLRMSSHAQEEAQDYAKAMYGILKEVAPITCQAFEDYTLNARKFSAVEMELIRSMINTSKLEDYARMINNQTERTEFLNKF